MADIVLSVASKVAEYLVAPVGRQCGYLIFTNSYVGELKEEIDKLENARQRVQHSVDEAQNNMKLIEAVVEEWMKKVDTVANKVRDVLDYEGRAKKTCFFGWLPNPKERYCLGRDARKTVQAIQELILQGKFDRVYYDVNSRAPIFHGIMKALDDEKLKVIGIYGPGGVGKTTLLKEVEKKLREEKRPFQMIIKAEVSRTPDLNNIQGQIADALSLNLKGMQSQQGRRDLLLERLKSDPNEKVLIILDDLWDKLDLKEVGIPTGDESMDCKLLLSSRFKDVLEKKMGADRTFRLEGLNSNEAFRLFEKTVGDRLKDEEELKRIAPQVVKKLAGLPLLITSVASTLKYSDAPAWRNALIKIEDSNVETIVKLTYDHLKSEDAKSLFLLCGLIGGTIRVETLLVLGMGLGLFEEFKRTIQDARDRLDKMLEELHSARLLLDGGDDKNQVTIHDLYSEVVVSPSFRGQNSLIMNNNSWSEEKLEKCWAICLMDVGSGRLAELLRHGFPDLKILMLSQPQGWWGTPASQHMENWWGTPVHRDVENWRGTPAHRPVGGCCKLDFTSMKQLRVLYIRSMHMPNLPSSIQILENLRSLYLDHCDVEDVAILGKLKALQILSFAGSTIFKLPKEIGDLMNLRSFNLSNCDSLTIIEPGVLKGLINLEELYMRGSFDRWMGEDAVPSESCNAKFAELKSLTKLTALEISIPDPTILLEAGDLPFGNLIRFWINIGHVVSRKFEGLRTMMLKLEGCDGILSKEWVQKTLHKTQYLHLDGLGESKENVHTLCNAHELCTQGFPQLKHLVIQNSPSIEYIVSSSGGIPLTAFMRLESLILNNLLNLVEICQGPIAAECLSKLKDVRIRDCDRLKYLCCLSQMQRFVHLEMIDVRGCESMRAIVIDDAREDIVVDDIVELPNVRRLDLTNLPRMTSFCIGAGITLEGAPIQMKEVAPKEEGSRSKAVVMSFPSLTHITIGWCRNFGAFNSSSTSVDRKLDKTVEENDESPQPLFNEMVKLPNIRSLLIGEAQCKELWNNQIPDDSFCKLESLELWDCDNLQRVVSSHMWKRLHRSLDILRVNSCHSIKIICEGDDTVMNSGKLRRLILHNLENLRHIWQSDGLPNVLFPILRFIDVRSCPRLRMLFPTFTPEFLGQIEELVVESCEDLELLAGHEECEEATGTAITFSELTALRLFELPKFRSFLPEKYSVEFPSLQVFSRVSCGTEPDQCLHDWGRYPLTGEFEFARVAAEYLVGYQRYS